MAPKLYYTILSPPVRAVLMCAKAIDLELDLIETDLRRGDHLKPEFIKLNPLHTVPTLDDNGLVLADSHAITAYLVSKYAKDKSLYPEDVVKRALVDQKLYFDSAVLFARHIRVAMPVLMFNQNTIPKEAADALLEAYGFLNTFLAENNYVAGNSLSIADLSIINTVTNASALVPLDESKFPNISAWRKRLEKLPYYDINRTGGGLFKKAVDEILSK